MLKHCTKLLLPGLIEYLSHVASLAEETAAQASHVVGVSEILKAFSAFFNSVQEEMSMYRYHVMTQRVNFCFVRSSCSGGTTSFNRIAT